MKWTMAKQRQIRDVLVWRSVEETNNEPYLAVYQRNGYYYAARAGKDSIAFILVDKEKNQIGLICSEHGPTSYTRPVSFTGSLDYAKENPFDAVIREAKEEAGYTIQNDNIKYFRNFEVGTQTNEHVHLFIVYVNKEDVGKREPQDEREEQSQVMWMEPMYARIIDDWKAVMLVDHVMRGENAENN